MSEVQDLIEVILKKPIAAHGEDVSVLKFRQPTAGDIVAVGNPVALSFTKDGQEVAIDDVRMASMISLLGGVPPSSVKQMGPRDFVNCCWALRGFFLPE